MIKVIDAAQHSVFMAAYGMTSKPIADAMCRVAARGVVVRAHTRYPIMHDTFIVVDGAHVETGSFHYTFAAAERNAENAMVISHDPKLAAKYSGENSA